MTKAAEEMTFAVESRQPRQREKSVRDEKERQRGVPIVTQSHKYTLQTPPTGHPNKA